MNIRDLQYLAAVARHRHFGRAAEECHTSQPTLSMQVKKLEEELGVQLLERSNKQVRVTQLGEQVVEHALRVLREAEEIRALAKAAQDPYAGEFRLGAFPTLAPYFLPLVVPGIHKAFPKLTLLLVEEKTETLVEKLREGELDAALLALPVEHKGLEAATLFDDPFVLAVPVTHSFATHTQVRQRDIAGEKLLLLEEGHCLRSQALEVCAIAGAAERQEFRATSLETLRQMVAAGVGMTLIPRIAVREDDGVAYIPFADPAPSRAIGLVWRATSGRKPLIQALLPRLTPARG